MPYWLMKTEPSTYSWSDLVRDQKTEWTGVRNYAARKHMRAMQTGDEIFIYHSGDCDIVGIANVIKTAHPDSTDDTGEWGAVDIVPVRALSKPVSLDTIKKLAACGEMVLLKQGRLSVQPVTAKEWQAIEKAAQ